MTKVPGRLCSSMLRFLFVTSIGDGIFGIIPTAAAQDSAGLEQPAAALLWIAIAGIAVVAVAIAWMFRYLARPHGKAGNDSREPSAPARSDPFEDEPFDALTAAEEMAERAGHPPRTEPDIPFVNKRRAHRYHLNRGGTVMANGKLYPVVIENISVGGIKGLGLPREVMTGASVTVAVEGSSTTLTTVAVLIKEGALHGQFVLTPEIHGKWERDFFMLVRDLVPLPDYAVEPA